MNNRTITVKGTGRISAVPDTIEINMNFSAKSRKQASAVERGAMQLKALQDAVEQCGLDRRELKSGSFRVSTEQKRVDRSNGGYSYVFDGYSCSQTAAVRIPTDMKLLSRVLDAVSYSGAEPQITLSFTVKDPEPLKQELLRSAAKDAAGKAAVLTEATGTRLGNLINISYSWGELRLESETDLQPCAKMMEACCDFDFAPEDINLEDTVAFVWELL